MQTIIYRKIQCVFKNALDFTIKTENVAYLAMGGGGGRRMSQLKL